MIGFTFADLFAGIGGMRLACEQNGGRCVFSSEIDKFCQQTYYANFGELPAGDIIEIDAKDIPDHDLLVAGFPCQPFSVAGLQKGFDDDRGGLFFEIVRILKEKRPKAFLLENVKGLLNHDGGRTFEKMTEMLKNIDYYIFYKVLNSKKYVPQNRERLFMVGFDRKRFDGDCLAAFSLEGV